MDLVTDHDRDRRGAKQAVVFQRPIPRAREDCVARRGKGGQSSPIVAPVTTATPRSRREGWRMSPDPIERQRPRRRRAAGDITRRAAFWSQADTIQLAAHRGRQRSAVDEPVESVPRFVTTVAGDPLRSSSSNTFPGFRWQVG